MTRRRHIDPWFTPRQAQIVADALELYTHLPTVPKADLREAQSARGKVLALLNLRTRELTESESTYG